jgi:quinoprotein dehydrogenase-associated probable ABC transporter substrate-binding protein
MRPLAHKRKPGWRRHIGRLLALAACTGPAAMAVGVGGESGMAVEAVPVASRPVLRVCQDPNNLPFSSRDLSGFENKIAALFARQLGWDIAYTWYPQRMGFIRNTLKAKEPGSDSFKCDLVTGVASGFDLGATTRPYYRSSYAMAYVRGRGLDGLTSLDDLLALAPARRQALRLGVFAGSPVVDWLLRNGLIGQIVSYPAQTGDPDQFPGQMVQRDLANGSIDIAFIWGPIGGYFARHTPQAPIVTIPLGPRSDARLDFGIAMAVRFGDNALKEKIDRLIVDNHDQINALLEQYGVPLLGPLEAPPLARTPTDSGAR